MLAVAAANCRSAAPNIGPAQQQIPKASRQELAGGAAGMGARLPIRLPGAGRLAEQNAEPVNGSLERSFQRGHDRRASWRATWLACCTSRSLVRPLVKRFCVMARACSCALMFSLAIVQPALITAHVNVIARHFAEQCHHCRAGQIRRRQLPPWPLPSRGVCRRTRQFPTKHRSPLDTHRFQTARPAGIGSEPSTG